MEKYNLVIEDENNCRLDKVIALKMKDLSRTQIQEMISNGSVLVNGKVAKAGYKTKLNDQIEIMMEDNIDLDEIRQAGQIIRDGGLVAFPTETVYGLGANAMDAEAAAKVYQAKGRPSDNPLIAHIADVSMLEDLVTEVPEVAKKLMDAFWPGPMTLIFNKSDKVPKGTTGGLDTVAVRFPNNKIACSLIKAAGVSIAAPSANLSGKPSPTLGEHVVDDMDGRIDMIIDGGMVGMGLESTIIDVTVEPPMILQ